MNLIILLSTVQNEGKYPINAEYSLKCAYDGVEVTPFFANRSDLWNAVQAAVNCVVSAPTLQVEDVIMYSFTYLCLPNSLDYKKRLDCCFSSKSNHYTAIVASLEL